MSKNKKRSIGGGSSPDRLFDSAMKAWKNGNVDEAIGYLRAAAECGSVRARQELKEVFGISLDYDEDEFYIDGETLARYKGHGEKVILPDGIDTIGTYAFEGCQAVTEVVFPDSLRTIEERAFKNCTALTKLEIPEGVKVISESAFEECTDLKSVVIPSGVELIDTYAFFACVSLEDVVISEGVRMIESYAFGECDSLSSIIIPHSVEAVDTLAFGNCTSLSRIICTERVCGLLDEHYRNKTVGAFLSRLKAGAVTEKEKNGWFEFISHNLMRCFSVMRDDVAFYTLALEQDWGTPDNIDEIMELSRSVECRAMVLERKKMNS